MKKILTIILMFTLAIVLTGCNKYRTYNEVNYDEFQTKLQNKETFVIVIGANSCSACAHYKTTTMEKIIKDYQVEIFYLDLDKLTEEEDSNIYSKFVVNSTPTTIFIKDGKETSTYDRIVGSKGYIDVVNSLKKHGYIGE